MAVKARTTAKANKNNPWNDVWVYGEQVTSGTKTYVHPLANSFVVENEIGKIIVLHEVVPETICREIGLTDKNGTKIYENDIVRLPDEDGYFTCEWEKDTARFVLVGDSITVDFDEYYGHQVEVVDNLFNQVKKNEAVHGSDI